jgi:hypothetical protein
LPPSTLSAVTTRRVMLQRSLLLPAAGILGAGAIRSVLPDEASAAATPA